MKYFVYEKTNVNLSRNPSFVLESRLPYVKRQATKKQLFQDTCLVIETESGTMIAYKKANDKKWIDV